MERYLKALHVATQIIEILVALALVALAGGALYALFYSIYADAMTGIVMSTEQFNILIGRVLEVFILVELFRIAMAYMRHQNVVPTVLEAALVAVARKFVVIEPTSALFQNALGLSALLLAVAISWWMLARSNACDLHE